MYIIIIIYKNSNHFYVDHQQPTITNMQESTNSINWSVQNQAIIVQLVHQQLKYTYSLPTQQGVPLQQLLLKYKKGKVILQQRKLILQGKQIDLIQITPHSNKQQQSKQQEQTVDQKKEQQEQGRKSKRKKDSKRKHRMKEKKRKQKRLRKQIEQSDPRYRGVPKLKKIKKRKNKRKAIPEEVKKEAEAKRQEDQYYKKIHNRGKISLSNIKRRQKAYFKSKNMPSPKIQENQTVKLEQQSHLSEGSLQEIDSKQTVPAIQRQIKRRVSRKQRQKEREEDECKVDALMKAKNERERREQIESMVRAQRMMVSKFGQKMQLQFDSKCKYYSQFKCRKGQVDKIGRLYCQLYNKQAVPVKGKHFFHMKIVRLTYQSITVGLITHHNLQNQYSRDKTNCICFDAYTHSIYVQGEKHEVEAQVKLNDILRTVVDIEKTTVEWYVNNEMIGSANIPSHMAQTPLYPYIQISNKWIKLRINDFQE